MKIEGLMIMALQINYLPTQALSYFIIADFWEDATHFSPQPPILQDLAEGHHIHS